MKERGINMVEKTYDARGLNHDILTDLGWIVKQAEQGIARIKQSPEWQTETGMQYLMEMKSKMHYARLRLEEACYTGII
jgi:hypothetical protein